ncbi:hypothetical protein B0H14DRAFT_2633914 [Mycena olivaceomarginata]|nr:hypothetical protein B0H14DRAFT_2633914 [Mycena olivaceomarginata]
MSQSGNAALAAQARVSPPPEPSTSLPSPSPSLSDLPEEASTPLNTPRALISLIRDTLASVRAKKKNLTVDGFSKCLAALDTLDVLLSCGDHIEASLNAFKLDLLAEINASALRSPQTSYATAVSTPAPPVPAPPPKAAAAKTCEVTVILDKSSDIPALPLPEIKAKVEAAIAATGVEKLKGITLRGVKVLPRHRLLVAADSDRAASLLKQSAAHWVPRLAKNSSLVVPRCQIVVNGVPTSFKPSSPTAAQDLYARNRSALSDPSVITEVRWLNPKAICDPKKKVSSLLVTISDVPSADHCIAQGLAIESTICYPPPIRGTTSLLLQLPAVRTHPASMQATVPDVRTLRRRPPLLELSLCNQLDEMPRKQALRTFLPPMRELQRQARGLPQRMPGPDQGARAAKPAPPGPYFF